MREVAFKASAKGKEKEEHNESRYISEEEDEVNFAKKIQRVLENLELRYHSNAFLVVELAIMLQNVLIKIIMKKERNMQKEI